MKKILFSSGAILLIVCAGFWWSRTSRVADFYSHYQAVLMDNGLVYYGKIKTISGDFSVLSDVYYVQSHLESPNKEAQNLLVRRGSEWHAPDVMIINTRHIIMIEPVTEGSKVAVLINELKTRNH